MHDQVVQVMARAFADHVFHVAMFQQESFLLNEVMFRLGIGLVRGRKVVATDGDEVVGFSHWATEDLCQPPTSAMLRLLPGMVRGLGLRKAARMGRFFSMVGKHDPSEPHLHLGPVGVDPQVQGRGVGTALTGPYIEDLERSAKAGFLETHGEDNVRFYRRFGFEIVGEVEMYGVANIFMRRPPSS
ncbi:MAG: GNAT family N-acetyltransferase [Deltaproteobacteria bacterium]|nr:GNAT family N-acetyltransferase [Deltaproteobacteria bacterium]